MNLRRLILVSGVVLPIRLAAAPVGFYQTNLVSNGAVPAAVIDADLKNPWGISFGPSSPFWVANNGTGTSTLYNGAGAKQGLIVTIPPAPGSPPNTAGTPTGTVFNGSSANFNGDRFLFATEDGTISGWQGSLGTTAAVRVDNSGSAVYKGLAIAGDRIFATDFAGGKVDVFDNGYNPITLSGGFLDPGLPSGYSPFGIQTIGNSVFVTYAKKEAGGDDDVAGPGFGFVDKFDIDGGFQGRLISGVPVDPNSPLNAPWGLALAPSGFGALANLLLVGNFGDGRINAFDPSTGAFVSALQDALGNPIVIDGLWGLAFGNSGPGFDANALYFTAGPNDEQDGLFGSLQAVPEPGTFALLSSGVALLVIRRRRRG